MERIWRLWRTAGRTSHSGQCTSLPGAHRQGIADCGDCAGAVGSEDGTAPSCRRCLVLCASPQSPWPGQLSRCVGRHRKCLSICVRTPVPKVTPERREFPVAANPAPAARPIGPTGINPPDTATTERIRGCQDPGSQIGDGYGHGCPRDRSTVRQLVLGCRFLQLSTSRRL